MSDFNSLTASEKYSHLNQTVMNMLNKPGWGWWAIFAVDMLFLAFEFIVLFIKSIQVLVLLDIATRSCGEYI